MIRKTLIVFILIMSSMIAGCSTKIEDYKQSQPSLNLFEYFEGKTVAWGMVQDYTGAQTRRFSVDIVGTVQADTLTLVEDFIFADGETSQRIWTIVRLEDGRYEGSAPDVIGKASGQEAGNALYWEYEMELDVDGDRYRVGFEDWMYRHDDKRLFNIAAIKKFGVEVGTVTLFFEKQ
ncbi:DUF3833 domain-containing protein [Vibrio astriarenae]|nr:DUF3833 domain-containing protein [Vibrio astriarenae]